MNHAAEMRLYATDRQAWIELAAPRIAGDLVDREDCFIAARWRRMSRDLQRAVWDELSLADRARVTAACASVAAARDHA